MVPVPAAFCWWGAIVLALWVLATQHRFQRLTPYLIIVFFFVIGGGRARLALQPPVAETDISRLAEERREVSLIGVLARSPAISQGRTTLLMEVQEIMDRGGRMTAAGGLIQLTMAVLPLPQLVPGDLFMSRATIGPVPSYGVPGAFNYQEYLAYQGIRASGWIRSPASIMEINRIENPPWTERVRYLPEVIRYRLSRFLAVSLPPQAAGVYQAILLGEQGNLSDKVREDFKASGSYHILSISGLHMALVSFGATLLLSWLLKRSEWVLLHLPATKVAALLSLLPLSLYAMIAGFNPPVVRSLIMVAVFIVALLVDRQWSIINNIAIAALLLLAVNPALLFTASFQLTFAAVAAIALFAPLLARIIDQETTDDPRWYVRTYRGVKKWVLASVLISLAATLGTAPILAYQFNRISLISPLSTLLIEPFLCLWSLTLGLAASLLIGVPSLSHLLFGLGGVGITIACAMADFCARLPWSFVWLPSPTIPTIVAWYGMMLLVANWRKLSRGVALTGIAAFLLLVVIPLLATSDPSRDTLLTTLDVGQGSAMVIELPNHEAILIDGGRMQSPSASGTDVGEALIAPFLWRKRIRRLTAIVCTHPDADHYNGIPFILQQFEPKTLWVNGYQSEESGYRRMLELAEQLKIEIKVPEAGMVLQQDGEVSLTALSGGRMAGSLPSGGLKNEKNAPGGNNQSLVLRLTHGQSSFLLPSDIEEAAEQALLKEVSLRSDVLIAPHHGSATSSSAGFVDVVAPRYVAISAGQNQAGHFPAPETVARYRKLGCMILNTAEHGSLYFRTNGREIQVATYR